jgi:hypothetical protein
MRSLAGPASGEIPLNAREPGHVRYRMPDFMQSDRRMANSFLRSISPQWCFRIHTAVNHPSTYLDSQLLQKLRRLVASD